MPFNKTVFSRRDVQDVGYAESSGARQQIRNTVSKVTGASSKLGSLLNGQLLSRGRISFPSDSVNSASVSARDPKIKAEFFAAWEEWKTQGEPEENRAEAAKRLKTWMQKNREDDLLSLDALGLKSLPPLPQGLRYFNASNNRLRSLPTLPKTLKTLDVYNNRLVSFPSLPPALATLDASRNYLVSLPKLPPNLESLMAYRNKLSSFPSLPKSLKMLKVANNQLTLFPDNIEKLKNFGRSDLIDLRNNPLSLSAIDRLSSTMNRPGYSGPRVQFYMDAHEALQDADSDGATMQQISDLPGFARNQPALVQAVARWAPEEKALCLCFAAYAGEQGASAFVKLLNRLDNAQEYKEPGLRQEMVDDLRDMAADIELRQRTFGATHAAGENCVNHASLIRTGNRNIKINLHIEQGRYDKDPLTMLRLVRSMFRIEQLDKIATRKIDSLNIVDDVKVYLAFQVKCKKELNLFIPVNEMRYFPSANVSTQELADAVKVVKALEKENDSNTLASYMATHGAMQPVFQRFYPETYEKAKEKLAQLATDERFKAKVQEELERFGMVGDVKAETDIRTRLFDERNAKLKIPMLQKFMRTHKLL